MLRLVSLFLMVSVVAWGQLPVTMAGGPATRNFVVVANHPGGSERSRKMCESLRKKISRQWFGAELKAWETPSKVFVMLEDNPTGALTRLSFAGDKFESSETFVSVSFLETIYDDELPHEISHILIADYFGKPAPRWMDEGIAVLSESNKMWIRYGKVLASLYRTKEWEPLDKVFSQKDYPKKSMTQFYAQAYSTTRFLVAKKNKATLLKFAKAGQEIGWRLAVQKIYGFDSVQKLENDWLGWVANRVDDPLVDGLSWDATETSSIAQ